MSEQVTQEQLNRAIAEANGHRISLAWMQRHPWDFKPCQANSQILGDFIREHNLGWSEESLEKAFLACKTRMAKADPPKLEEQSAEVQNDPFPLPKEWPGEVPFQTRRDVLNMAPGIYRFWFHSPKHGAAFRARADAILKGGR